MDFGQFKGRTRGKEEPQAQDLISERSPFDTLTYNVGCLTSSDVSPMEVSTNYTIEKTVQSTTLEF